MNSTATDLKRMNPQRQKLNADIEAFLARGGVVQSLESYASTKMSYEQYHSAVSKIDKQKKAARGRKWDTI